MSLGAILGAITALGAIAGMVTYLVKTGVWVFKKAPASKAADINAEVLKEKHDVQEGGRPKW